MNNKAVFHFRQYWNRLGKPFTAELRWVRHILLGRLIDGNNTRPTVDVSVMIPCHNYAHVLPRAIESILRQTVRPLEILVIDDASNDDTQHVAESYASKGVSYLRVDHHDLSRTRNSAADATSGKFLLYLDADDHLPEKYIELCLQQMDDKHVGLAYGNLQYENEKHDFIENPAFDVTLLSRYNFISSNALIRRQAFDLVGGYRTIPHSFEDWDFNRRVIAQGYTAAKADTYVWYDVHNDSMLQTHNRSSHASYVNEAALLHHPFTVFTIFTDPYTDIDAYIARVKNAGFDHTLLQLVWYNTCDNDAFDSLLRSKLASCPFGSLRYMHAPAPAGTKREQDILRMRAWHSILRPGLADYILSLSPEYLLPVNGIQTMLSHLREDIGGVFAPCTACGNNECDGTGFVHNPCFCCAIVRRGSMYAIIPWQTEDVIGSSSSFNLIAYKRLRRQLYVLHCKDMWKENQTSETLV